MYFQQHGDSFIIIDCDANITLYKKVKYKLEKSRMFFMHSKDKQFLIKNQYNFQKMVLYWFNKYEKLGGALVIESKVIYLFDNSDMIADEILTSQDNASSIRSNVPYYKIDGPNQYFGQDQYILLYIYKDVDFDNFYVR